jgi:hypothetical protein
MQQIADWLKTLGMSEYAERFAENRIDSSVLHDLTDQDLKDLEHVPPELNRQDSHGVLDRRFYRH